LKGRLGGRISLRMARPRHVGPHPEPPPHLPAPLRMHRPAQRCRHPGRHVGASPEPAIQGLPVKRRREGLTRRGRQQPWLTRIALAEVTQACGAVLVVTRRHRAYPLDAVTRAGRTLCSAPPVSEEPDDLPGAAHHRRLSSTIAALHILKRERGLNRESFGHAPIIHEDFVLLMWCQPYHGNAPAVLMNRMHHHE
jgi:hypothetical protein